MIEKKFTWIPFYMELADKLLQFKDDRSFLVDVVYELGDIVKYIKDDNGNRVSDIDPFTVFGIFNRSLTIENRQKVCKHFKDILDIEADVPQDFEGVPVVMMLMATFVWRGKVGIDTQPMWDLFEAAINKDEKTLPIAFDKVCSLKGIKWNITMALYWIRPYEYLGLDSRNREYLPKIGIEVFNENMLNAEHYFSVVNAAKEKISTGLISEKNFAEISYAAWVDDISEDVKEKDKGEDSDKENIRYWVYAPGENARLWDECYQDGVMRFGWTTLGDYAQFSSKEAIQNKLQELYPGTSDQSQSALMIWNFLKEIKAGDVIYVKKGRSAIVGRGIVKGDYFFDETKSEYFGSREVNWTHKGEWNVNITLALKTLTDISGDSGMKKYLEDLFKDSQPVSDTAVVNPKQIIKTPYDPYIKLLKESKNLILTGAPGTGKTYITTTLGVLLCSPERFSNDHKEQKRVFRELQQQGRIGFTTFHQSMDYEDFVEGLKPDTTAQEVRFELKKGILRQMCDNANQTDKPCLLIIDEINRANISKVLGELITLIEPTKRLGEEDEFCVTLPYSGDTFGVPSNLYIIGTMNTADRSLGYIDYAIRRRFAFKALKTEPSALMDYYGGECNLLFKERELMTQVRKLLQVHRNKDFSIDDIMVGHSYFMARDEDGYNFNLKYKIKPLLEEYLRDGILVEKGTEVKDAILELE